MEAAERERLRKRSEEEEQERLRLKRLGEEEAEQLLKRLKLIEEEESERKKKKKMAEMELKAEHEKKMRVMRETERVVVKAPRAVPTTNSAYMAEPEFSSAAFGDEDLMGITEEEVDKQCDELFDTTPIKFKPRKNEMIDEMISLYITSLEIMVPIVWIKGNLYLIGSQRLTCEMRGESLILRVGGGYQKFDEWVMQNHRYFMRMLVIYMIKSGESLEWVVEQLILGNRIKNIHAQQRQQQAQERRVSKSPSRSSISPMRKSPLRNTTPRSSVRMMTTSPRVVNSTVTVLQQRSNIS